MFLITRRFVTLSIRFALLLMFVAALSGCSMFQSSDAPSEKKGWSAMLPWGGKSVGGDATQYIEYQRTKAEGQAEPMYTLLARNTHMTKTIEGQMRTTLQTSPGDMKMDSQTFTLAPNEQKRLLIYPTRFPLTYEVTASFRVQQ